MTDFTREQWWLQHIAAAMGIMASAFLVLLSAAVIYLFALDSEPPFVSSDVLVRDLDGRERNTFRAGELMEIRRSFCVARAVPVVIGRHLREETTGTGVYVNTTQSLFRKGCFTGGNIVQIPPFTPPGTYRYSVNVRYSNNPLQDAAVELPIVRITVVK